MTSPWEIDNMTLDQARREYARMRARNVPSTADLRREADLCRRIDILEEQERRARPMQIAEKVAFGRQLYAGGQGR